MPKPTKHGEVPHGNTHPSSRVQCQPHYSAHPTAAREQETGANKCGATSPLLPATTCDFACKSPHEALRVVPGLELQLGMSVLTKDWALE